MDIEVKGVALKTECTGTGAGGGHRGGTFRGAGHVNGERDRTVASQIRHPEVVCFLIIQKRDAPVGSGGNGAPRVLVDVFFFLHHEWTDSSGPANSHVGTP